jgi:hypothetical protein
MRRWAAGLPRTLVCVLCSAGYEHDSDRSDQPVVSYFFLLSFFLPIDAPCLLPTNFNEGRRTPTNRKKEASIGLIAGASFFFIITNSFDTHPF